MKILLMLQLAEWCDKIEGFFRWSWRVIKGHWYSLTDNEATREMARGRLAICEDCYFRKGKFCGSCGCPLKAKTRVKEEKCPEGFW